MRKDWWVPLTGVAFIVLLIISLLIGGEPPEADDGAAKVVAHYADDKDAIEFGAAISVAAASLLVWFGATLRDAMRDPGGDDGIAPAVLFAGAIITAVGAALDSTLSFAIAEAVDDRVNPTSILALQAFWDNDFFPLALGAQLFFLAGGLAILRRGLFPAWLGWVGIILGILGLTPIGFFAFLVGAVWIVVLSVMLTLAYRAPAAQAPTAM
jgi:hypothetical protein